MKQKSNSTVKNIGFTLERYQTKHQYRRNCGITWEIFPMKRQRKADIGFTLERFQMKLQYLRNIGIALVIFAMEQKYCTNIGFTLERF